MATHLIGLTGRKRSGKDSFAQALIDTHGYKRFAFADKLREAALAIDPIVGAEADDTGRMDFIRLSDVIAVWGWEGVKDSAYDAEVRRTLQRVGVTARELDEDIWVRPVMEAVEAHDGPAVITDVRFPNEHAAVMAAGITVRIVRPGLPEDDLHISETALDEHYVDYEVTNSADLDELRIVAQTIGSDYHTDLVTGNTRLQVQAQEAEDLRGALQRAFR